MTSIRRGIGSALAAFLLAAMLAPALCSAQEPRVGLVLSGGAAKGFAHVGAIRVLEEAGLPVDIVTGTSMGAVIGGLYAIGYTPDAIEDVVLHQDWAALFSDAGPRSALDIERRADADRRLVALPLENGSVRLPSGVIEGQQVLGLLARLTWDYHPVTDFSRLPRSFASVVMDLRTGEAVALKEGSLPLAIRASMSIPALFEPVVIDGRTLVDGGLVRNLPATDALDLGADVLVCVDVSEPPPDEEFSAGTLLDVVLRTAFLRGEAATREERGYCDVLIEPELEGLGAFAFDAAAEWIGRGEAAARAVRSEITALTERIDRPPTEPPSAPQAAPVELVAVEVEGGSADGARLVRQRLGLDLPVVVTPTDVAKAIERVYGSREFSLVSYRALPVGEESPRQSLDPRRLRIRIEERRRDLFGFGFRYDSRERAALLFDVTLRNRLAYGSTTQMSVRLGRETQIALGYFDRIGVNSPTGIGATAEFTRVPIDAFPIPALQGSGGELDLFTADARFGWTVANAAYLRLGVNGEHLAARPDAESDSLTGGPLETIRRTFYSLQARVVADTRDDGVLPARGVFALFQAELADERIGSGADFRHYLVDLEAYVPIGGGFVLAGRAALTSGEGSDLPASRWTYLGGLYAPRVLPGRFFPLMGVGSQALVGRRGQFGRLGLRWMPKPDVFLELAGDVGSAGEEWTLGSDELQFGVGVTAGIRTPIGPVAVTFAGDELGDFPTVGFRLGPDF